MVGTPTHFLIVFTLAVTQVTVDRLNRFASLRSIVIFEVVEAIALPMQTAGAIEAR